MSCLVFDSKFFRSHVYIVLNNLAKLPLLLSFSEDVLIAEEKELKAVTADAGVDDEEEEALEQSNEIAKNVKRKADEEEGSWLGGADRKKRKMEEEGTIEDEA